MMFTPIALIPLITVSSATFNYNYGYTAPSLSLNPGTGSYGLPNRLPVANPPSTYGLDQGTVVAPSINTYPKQSLEESQSLPQSLEKSLPKPQGNYLPADQLYYSNQGKVVNRIKGQRQVNSFPTRTIPGLAPSGTRGIPITTPFIPTSTTFLSTASITSSVQTDLNNLGPDFSTTTTIPSPTNMMIGTPSVSTLNLQGNSAIKSATGSFIKISTLSLLLASII